jgi:CheY-like chemotaxis protein
MALRVLLADESSTIKKVMQLALQDFGVEVKAVPIGLDVLQVAKSFQPDLIFADVLLSKKNGYEVASEIKSDPAVKSIPVVLMWSGFMELDEVKAQACGAERRLEKPFDADHLRSLVKDLVPRLNENKIANYLSFPDLPDIVETPQEPAAPQPPPPPARSAPKAPAAPPPAPRQDAFSMNADLEDPDDFQQVPLPGAKTKNSFERRDEEEWRQGGLEQFRVSPEPLNVDTGAFIDVNDASIAMTDGVEDLPLEQLEDLTLSKQAPAPKAKPHTRTFGTAGVLNDAPVSMGALDPMRAEEVLREQVREVLENIAWKIIPDIAERIVREEIQRLLKEAERL